MDSPPRTRPVTASTVAPRTRPSLYPEPFASRMAGRRKRALGEVFGLANFGVNLTTLAPGASSALRHAHSLQDEFVYVLSGSATLHDDDGSTPLQAGMCVGFRAGNGRAHRIVNTSDSEVVYLEVGDRSPGDTVTYPDDDLMARFIDGAWRFLHKDGSPY